MSLFNQIINFFNNGGSRVVPVDDKKDNTFVGVVLNHQRSLEINDIEITPKLLNGIVISGCKLMLIESVVITRCRFSVTEKQFSDFLKKLDLRTLEISEGSFSPDFITDELIRIPKESVKISSQELIKCPNVTNGLINEWIGEPEKLVRKLEITNVELGFELDDLLPAIEEVSAQPEVGKINWRIGVLHYTDANKNTMLKLQHDERLITSIVERHGIRDYNISLKPNTDSDAVEQPEPRFSVNFWIK